jgi:bacitracin synthase 1
MRVSEHNKEGTKVLPATSGQKRLFFLSMLEGGEAPYHLPGVIKFNSRIDADRFNQAFRLLIKRHDCLRTGFEPVSGGVNQVILSDLNFELKRESCLEIEVEKKLEDLITPFDLAVPPLLNATLLTTEDSGNSYLLIDIHHIASDGISWTILLKDLENILNSRPLDPTPFSYAESSSLLNDKANSSEFLNHKKFWLEYFEEIPEPLELPTDYRRAETHNFSGDVNQWVIADDNYTSLKNSAKELGVSLHIFLLSVYTTLLKSISGQDKFVVSFPHSGRFEPELEDVAGMFAGTGLLKVNPETTKIFLEYARETGREIFKIFDHLEYPFEEIVDNLDIRRDLSRNPLTDISFVYETAADRKLDITGIESEFYPLNKHTSSFDLTLDISDNGQELLCAFEYSTTLFKKSTIENWRNTFSKILNQIIEKPDIQLGRLDILDISEKELLLKRWNQTDSELSFETVPEEIQRLISQNRDSVAVVSDEEHLSYEELRESANRVADNLIDKHSVSPEDIVVVVLDRSIWIPSILLGIWEVGACYLPIDPSTPIDRILDIIQLSGSRTVISDIPTIYNVKNESFNTIQVQDLLEKPSETTERKHKKYSPDSLAYIIYTSGTTGTPKGVKITHANLVNYINWAKVEYLNDECFGDFPLFTSLAFDLTVTSLFLPLIAGRSLNIKKSTLLVNESLKEIFNEDSGIDAVKMTPSHVLLLNDPSIKKETGIRLIILGGEEVLPKHLEILSGFIPVPRIVNEYGPTETTVGVVAKDLLVDDKNILIGKPIYNTHAYLLNDLHELTPIKSVGDLYISGKSISIGYHNDIEITKERFIDGPFVEGEILYKTGDLARWTEDGELEYLGRSDQQLKIRGYRVDPLEIQKEIFNLDQINNAVVIDREDEAGKIDLIVYYTARTQISISEIQEYLGKKLPSHMIPTCFVQLEEIPLTVNGKVNKKALPEPDNSDLLKNTKFVVPQGSIEKTVVEVWEKVLNRSPISATDNYFHVGGDSIQSIQIVSRMAKNGYKITVRDIFEAPTPSELAKRAIRIDKQIVIDQSKVTGLVNLSPIQKRFFRQNSFYRSHYTQAITLTCSFPINYRTLKESLTILHERHDMLRARYRVKDGTVQQLLADENFIVSLEQINVNTNDDSIKIEDIVERLAGSFNLAYGPLLKSVLLSNGEDDSLLLVAHHLIMDAVSWSIMIADLNLVYQQLVKNKRPKLPQRTHSYQDWVNRGEQWLETYDLNSKTAYWEKVVDEATQVIDQKSENIDAGVYGKTSLQSVEYSENETEGFEDIASHYGISIQDILLSAMELHLEKSSDANSWVIDLEHFGRTTFSEDLDLSHTIGWFTSIYPCKLLKRKSSTLKSRLKEIHRTVQENAQISHEFLLLEENGKLQENFKSPALLFNYLGDVANSKDEGLFSLKELIVNGSIGEKYPRSHPFEMEGWIENGKLELHLVCPESYSIAEIELWWNGFMKEMGSFLTDAQKEIEEESKNSQLIDDFIAENFAAHTVQSHYPLTPVQEGMYFHQLKEPDSLVYHEVFRLDLSGPLNETIVQKSWDKVREIHPILRSSFHSKKIPYPVQLVHRFDEISTDHVDLTTLSKESQENEIKSIIDREYHNAFDLSHHQLQRIILIKLDENRWTKIWVYPHILLDGWSTAIVLENWFEIYAQLSSNGDYDVEPINSYKEYVNWYRSGSSIDYWNKYLNNSLGCSLCRKVSRQNSSTSNRRLIESLSDSDSSILKKIATEHNATVSQIVHLLWALAVGRQIGQSDVVFGSVKSVRPSEIPNLGKTAGLFLTTLPVRSNWSDEKTIGQLLDEIRDYFLEREDFLRISLTDIGADGIFDHILTVENFPIDTDLFESDTVLGGKIKLDRVETFEATHFPLTVEVYLNESIEYHFLYNPYSVDETTLQNMIENIRKMVGLIENSTEMTISDVMEELRSDSEISEETGFIESISEIDEDF